MGKAIEHLWTRLASVTVVVPPYVRAREGHLQHVSGYIYDRELSLPQPDPVDWASGTGTAAGTPEVVGVDPVDPVAQTETESMLGKLRTMLHGGDAGESSHIVVSPIHRGPGPVMTRDEAEEWTRDSALPGPWYHGGTGRSGLGARIWERGQVLGMDSLGRGYYVTDRPNVAGGYGGESGITRALYLNVRKPMWVGSDEWQALQTDPEVDELKAMYPDLGRIYAMQLVAQRRGYDAFAIQKMLEPGNVVTTVSVFDAREVAVVEEDVRDPIRRVFA